MATINSLINTNYNNAGLNAVKREIDDLKKAKVDAADLKEHKEQLAALEAKYKEAKASSVSVNSQAVDGISELFSYMNHGGNSSDALWGAGTFSDANGNALYGSAGQLANLKAMNSARIGIENRARVLASEIGVDRAKGYDVSAKQKALQNLTGNLDILDKNLSYSIDKAVSEHKSDKHFINVVEMLRKALEPAKPVDDSEVGIQPEEIAAPETGVATDYNSAAAAQSAQVAQSAEDSKPVSEEKTNEVLEQEAVHAPEEVVEGGVTPANA